MNRFEFLKKIKLPKPKIPSVGRIIFWAISIGLAAATFVFARNFTSCWNITGLPGIAPSSCGTSTNPLAGPDLTAATQEPGAVDSLPTPAPVAPGVELPPAWDGGSRINILFIGLDFRDWQANDGPPRSDTMILFTIDPVTKSAGMLSIPRDLWVNIPEGFGYSRINTAYSSGEGAKLPGGGPGLAMKTVEQLLGVPVHYYAQVDFNTFTELVNRLGCIYVVPEEILVLDPVGPGTDHVVITPGGERKLCGWKVLAYARTRKTEGGDMDRARRQQQVIFALQQKIFDPEVFPSLIAQAPEMYAELSSGIHTNMPLDTAIKLAILGKDITRESIKTGIIGTDMVTFESTTLGGQAASVMKPIMDKVRVLRDEIFTSGGPTSPVAVPFGNVDGNLITQAMREEEARVRVVDGTFTTGLDQRAGSFFQSQGMNVTEVGPASEIYSSTFIIVYGPKLYTVKYLQAVFGIPASNIRFSPDPASTVDIEIRLGSDLAGSIP